MARYQCGTTGQYCELLLEDAMHAMDGYVRFETDEGEKWVKSDIDPKAEVAEVIREIAHHLNKANAGARALERIMEAHGLAIGNGCTLHEYIDAMAHEEMQYADDWAWLYGEEPDNE